MTILEIHHIGKKFGSHPAVSDVQLRVHSGDIYALVGSNGAGKTTLIKMITGLLIPTSGTAEIAGHNIQKEPLLAKKQLGYVPDEPSGYDYLTGMEFLVFTARLRGLSGKLLASRIHELSGIFPVSDIINHQMGQYSRGNKQKILLLAALITEPELLIIDEPVVGLDPPSIKTLGNLLKLHAKNGHAVFFVTHMLEFAKHYATRIGIMKSGSIIRQVASSDAGDVDSWL